MLGEGKSQKKKYIYKAFVVNQKNLWRHFIGNIDETSLWVKMIETKTGKK